MKMKDFNCNSRKALRRIFIIIFRYYFSFKRQFKNKKKINLKEQQDSLM